MDRNGGTPLWMLPLFGFLALSDVLLLNTGFRPVGFLLIGLAVAVLIAFAVRSRGKKIDDIND